MTDTSALRFHGDQVARPGMRDFAVNVWPASRPKKLRRALLEALESDRYPNDRAARSAVARRVERPLEEVLLLNGAAEAFWLLAQTLQPRRPVCVHPSFTEAEAALAATGSEVGRVFRNRDDFALDLNDVPEEADFVVICNPNNPTGNLERAVTLEKLARPGRVVVVDEAFMDFARTSRESLVGRRDLTGFVVVRSFTKLWGIPGIRAGFLVGQPELVARLAARRQPWSVNAVACAAIEACASDGTTRKQVAREVASARRSLELKLARLPGVRVWPSEANFLLVEVPDGIGVAASLFTRGFAVRPASSFPGLTENHLRIAVRAAEENDQLVAALIEVFEEDRR